MNSRVLSNSFLGIDAYIVEVEANLSSAHLTRYVTVGLPDNAVKESRELVTAGIFTINSKHLSEVIQYRSLDRQLWLG